MIEVITAKVKNASTRCRNRQRQAPQMLKPRNTKAKSTEEDHELSASTEMDAACVGNCGVPRCPGSSVGQASKGGTPPD